MAYEGLQTETVTIRGHNGDMVEAYYARPSKPGKVPGVVVLMHIIGWDEWILETTRPVAPIDLSATISAPMLGLFGNDDMNPNRADVNKTEETLKRLGKTYEFHRYDGAGHAFLNWNAPSFRSAAAADAWPKIYAWYA